MDTPPNKDNLEVMGVSRSGRVRKKSSKLMDFKSPDEIDGKTHLKHATKSAKHAPPKQSHLTDIATPIDSSLNSFKEQSDKTLAYGIKSEMEIDCTSPTMIDEPDCESDFDLDDMMVDDIPDSDSNDMPDSDDGDGELFIDTTVRKSAYMTEKSNKKTVMKDGKLVLAKLQRKDKGMPRFTAYMLWAREIRKSMLAANPDIDFATISRRLGEMWANVRSNEKYNWRRRAKRMSLRIKKNKGLKERNIITKQNHQPSSKFLNRNATVSAPVTASLPVGRPRKHPLPLSTTNHLGIRHQQTTPVTKSNTPHKVGPITNKPVGTTPTDVAAHLKLLGDSLSIIGERLKEHEGQITVSGSLSVLLDTLLCSLGPLICLTKYIPEISNDLDHLSTTMSDTLDNIAYVMPGL